MKLRKIAIENLWSWEATTIELHDPITLVLGANGVGKTSLARAVELGLRGAVTVPGVNLEDLIRTGAKRGKVTLDVELDPGRPAVEVRRTVTPREVQTAVNGHATSKAIHDFLGLGPRPDPQSLLRVVCNASGFFELKDDQQKELLLGLVDQAVPEAVLTATVPRREEYLPATVTLADLETAYDRVYRERTERKARLNHLAGQLEEMTTDRPDVEAIEQKLTQLRAEERQLLIQTGMGAGEKEQLKRREMELTARRDQLGVRQQELADAAPDVTPEVLVKQLAEAKEKVDRLRAQSKARSSAETDIRRMQDAKQRLAALGAKCVISEDIGCPLPAADRMKAVARWGKSIAALQAKHPPIDTDPAERQLRQVEKVSTEATRIAQQAETTRREHETCERELGQVRDALKKQTPDDGRAGVAALQQRIRMGEENLKMAIALRSKADAADATSREHAVLTAQLADLETLCAVLGSKGIRERLLLERVAALQERVNEIVKRFGLRLEFVQEPWGVRCRCNGRPIRLASTSERFRAGIAFQVALAAVTGLHWLLVDGVDVLDLENRSALVSILETTLAEGWVSQVILLATLVNRDTLQVPPPKGWGVITLTVDATGRSRWDRVSPR